jgi:hypothetical protein
MYKIPIIKIIAGAFIIPWYKGVVSQEKENRGQRAIVSSINRLEYLSKFLSDPD